MAFVMSPEKAKTKKSYKTYKANDKVWEKETMSTYSDT